ncbi:MAG: thiol:disulfide interchange protein DsbA/DsbL [Burkholderiales bacterium]|nr:thiol:disulfide interchange protein DsbA/DsbL [Burkholderiales bacterium]
MLAIVRALVCGLCIATACAAQAQTGATVALSLGKNYREIAQQPLADGARIEVIDFFFYGCPFCNQLRPMLESWRKALPADVVFRRVPAVRRDSWVPLARTYYTLEALGEVERLHEEVYKAYHDEELHLSTPEVMADWARRQGLDRQKWLDLYHSAETTRKVEQARRMTELYAIEGTPSVVVNGRYLTSSGMTDDVKLVVPVAQSLIGLVRARR